MADIDIPRGPASGARAVTAAIDAGFRPISSGPAPHHGGEILTVLEHPDGRRAAIYTTVLGGLLVTARPVERDGWPDSAQAASSVPGVTRMVNAT